MPIVVKVSNPFKKLYNLPLGTSIVICTGGRGGMKTYEVSKYVAKSACIDKKRCVILRDEKSLIKESILNEILLRYETADKNGVLSIECEKLHTGIKDRKSGEELVFTKGFRASDNSKRANMKGVSNIDIAIIEEAEDIRDEEKFNTFVDSLRKEGCLIIILMNTPDIGHFLVKRYFTTVNTEHDGYFKLVPKSIPGFACIQTSYKDNKWLPAHVVSNYEGYGNPEHHLYNLHYYLTAILGYSSTGRKGQILKKVKPIKLSEYLKLPFKEYYGQDFGTSSPAGMVGVKFDKNNCYCRQINYLPMDTLTIGKKYCELKLGNNDKIIGDSAEPKTIERLKSGWKPSELDLNDIALYPQLLKGFFIEPCIKGSGSIKTGIGLMQSLNLFAVEESKDLWHEIHNWVYATDKNEQPTDEPVDDFNHLIDPWRYVISDYKGLNKPIFLNQYARFR